MCKTQEENKNEAPGKEYATKCYIFWIASYLIFITFVSIIVLATLWPSCEDISWTSSTIDDLAVTSISPSYGEIKGGTPVSIRGTGFKEGVEVSFGTVPVPNKDVIIADSTHIRVKTPSISPSGNVQGIVDIVVTNPNQKPRVLSPGFLYTDSKDKPYISSVSPNSGPLKGGQPVTIKGTGFQNKATGVSFGGVPGTYLRIQNDSSLVTTTPAHGAGKVDVVVEAGGTTTLPESYTYTCEAKIPYLFIMVILAGALGGSLHGLRSLVWHVGHRKLRECWLLKYILMPISGAAIAVMFFWLSLPIFTRFRVAAVSF